MRQRDKCLEDLRKVTHTKMREAELKPLESDIKILEMRLGHAEKSRDYEVCGPLLNHNLSTGVCVTASGNWLVTLCGGCMCGCACCNAPPCPHPLHQRNRSILVISQEQETMKREREKIEVRAKEE